MPRKAISFDVDGVVADGGYVPLDQRTNRVYFQKPPVDPLIPAYLNLFSMSYDIFFVSFREHDAANLGLRAWLAIALDLNLDTVAGVITHPTPGGDPGDSHNPGWKLDVIRAIGAVIHIDDDPSVIALMPGTGLLYPSEIPSSQAAAGRLPTVYSWEQLREFLTTPGLTIHGSDGTSVSSPATAEGLMLDVPLVADVARDRIV